MLVLLSATTSRGLLPRVAARVRGSVRFAASADDEWALPPGWARALAGEVGSPRFAALKAFVAAERAAGTVYPPPEQTLAALRAVDVDDVRCVIVGQDPYHTPGRAHGLAFSVPPGVPPPPSLRNVLAEVAADVGGDAGGGDGDLSRWAADGVLLLNSVLTVRPGAANSHAGNGWEAFTDAVVGAAAANPRTVFLLWGGAAKRKLGSSVGADRAVATSHPSVWNPKNSSNISTAVKSNSFPTMLGPFVFAPRVLDDWRESPQKFVPEHSS